MAPRAANGWGSGDDSERMRVDSVRSLNNEDVVWNAGRIRLEPTQMFGKAIEMELSNTLGTNFVKEITNFNQKTMATSVLMFITAVVPVLTFGTLYTKATGNNIGTVETIMAASAVGIIYPLIGGMPMVIMGPTAPVLAFTAALHNLSNQMDVPFLPLFTWTSLFTCVFCIISAFLDGASIRNGATRFTEEIFLGLVVSIYVLDGIGNPFDDIGILKYFDPSNPINDYLQQTNNNFDYVTVALLATFVGFGTTLTIFWMRSFKKSSYFCNQAARTMFHDFAVIVSVVIWSVIGVSCFPRVPLEMILVPNQVEPTYQCCDDSCTMNWPVDCMNQENPAGVRSWMVDWMNDGGRPIQAVALGTGFLGFILIYMDNTVTWNLVYDKSHKLQNGTAYNYDMILTGIFNFILSLFGLPWMVATTVPSLIYITALAEKDRDGRFIDVQETRLCSVIAHFFLGLTLTVLEQVISWTPVPILYGVFLFMGLAELPCLQFWDRLCLMIMEPSKYPSTPYTQFVENGQIHKFTILQVLAWILVVAIQNIHKAEIVFPIILLLCIPVRLALNETLFKGYELLLLDGLQMDIETWLAAKEKSLERKALGKGRDIEIDDDLEDKDAQDPDHVFFAPEPLPEDVDEPVITLAPHEDND